MSAGYWWDVAVPGARHRVARDRRQPDLRRHPAGGDATERAAPVIDVRDLEVAYRVRGTLAAGAARHLVLDRARRVVRAGRRVGLRQVDGGAWPRCATWPRTAASPAARSPSTARTWSGCRESELRELRSRTVSMVYQDPTRALNPSLRVGRQLSEVFEIAGASKSEARASGPRRRCAASRSPTPASVLRALSAPALRRHGAARRDRHGAGGEPEAADPGRADHRRSTRRSRRRCSTSSRSCATRSTPRCCSSRHNLGVIAKMCDRVGVLYAGAMVEEGTAREVFDDPRHPYTVGLLRCIPRRGQRKDHGRLDTIPGFLPPPGADLPGCVFADRCAIARRPLPHRAAAGLRARRRPAQPLPLPRARRRTLPRQTPSDVAIAGRHRTRRTPILARDQRREDVQAGRPRRARAGRRVGRAVAAARRSGLVGESGSRQDDVRARRARHHRARRRRHARARRRRAGRARSASGRTSDVRALQIVFQNPDSALNRSHTVRRLVGRALSRLAGLSRRQARGAPARADRAACACRSAISACGRRRCPAASSSASPSRAPSPATRGSWSATSRPARSTSRCRRRS